MADGTFRPGVADRHPDPTAEAIRWETCEGQVMQIIGRGRGVNRTMVSPLDVWVLADVVLPLPVDKTLRAADLALSPVDLMLAAAGIAFLSPEDASRAYQELWETPKAVEHALARPKNYPQNRTSNSYTGSGVVSGGNPYTGLGVVSVWTYRRAGARGPAATALVDESRHGNPAAALAAALGPLRSAVPRWAAPVERARSPGEALNATLGRGSSAGTGRSRRGRSIARARPGRGLLIRVGRNGFA